MVGEREIDQLLEGVTAYIGQRPDWWYEQLQACADPERERAMTGWYELAQQAASPEMSYEALRQFKDLVEAGSIAWPLVEESSFEAVVLGGVRAVVDAGERRRRFG